MAIVKDLIAERDAKASGMIRWQKYWRDVARFVLPHTESFDYLLSSNPTGAIDAVAVGPVASEKSPELHTTLSVWALERLTGGLLSLKTPETQTWHDLIADDEFEEYELDGEAKATLERIRDYQFKVRGNPASGFWPAHKAALRSCCAFGDGWMFVTEEFTRGAPWRYEFASLPSLVPGVDAAGRPNMMYRTMKLSAHQIATRWGDKAGAKIIEYANDERKRHNLFTIMHGVRQRDDANRGRLGVRGAMFESHYVVVDEEHHIGEGGYYEFPFIRYAWNDSGANAQCEGPVAYALSEIKSLNEMEKQQLIAGHQMIRPPLGIYGRNFQRLNFNPGQTNPGLVSAEGRPLFSPLNTGARPDFAAAIIEAKRNDVKDMLYLPLWQALINSPEQTATEALIKAQEKGELLGPVGISLNRGLNNAIEREIGIMERKGAFAVDGPFPLPQQLLGADIGPRFTSPLDKLRRMGDLVAMQRLAAFAGQLAEMTQDPTPVKRLDVARMIELAQEILGAPIETLLPEEAFQQGQDQSAMLQQLMTAVQGAQGAGAAMGALGSGTEAMARGADAMEQMQKSRGSVPQQTLNSVRQVA